MAGQDRGHIISSSHKNIKMEEQGNGQNIFHESSVTEQLNSHSSLGCDQNECRHTDQNETGAHFSLNRFGRGRTLQADRVAGYEEKRFVHQGNYLGCGLRHVAPDHQLSPGFGGSDSCLGGRGHFFRGASPYLVRTVGAQLEKEKIRMENSCFSQGSPISESGDMQSLISNRTTLAHVMSFDRSQKAQALNQFNPKHGAVEESSRNLKLLVNDFGRRQGKKSDCQTVQSRGRIVGASSVQSPQLRFPRGLHPSSGLHTSATVCVESKAWHKQAPFPHSKSHASRKGASQNSWKDNVENCLLHLEELWSNTNHQAPKTLMLPSLQLLTECFQHAENPWDAALYLMCSAHDYNLAKSNSLSYFCMRTFSK